MQDNDIDLPCGGPCDLGSEAEELEDELESFLSVGEASASEVVYVREHVCVWPERKQRIPGRLSLVKQHCVLFMSWLPYGSGVLKDDGSYQSDSPAKPSPSGYNTVQTADHSLYAIHPIPLTEVRVLRAHTPRMGPQRLDITLISGVTLTPLHLPTQAIQQFIKVVSQHVALVPSANMKATWLVNEPADPLMRSLSALDLGDVLLGGPPRGGAHLTWAPPAPPPASRASVMSPWANWVSQSETVWDVLGLDTSTTAAPTLSRDLSASQMASSVAGMGRSAWRALSSGLSRLVAEFPSSSLGFTNDGDYGVGTEENGQVVMREGRGAGELVSWQEADGLGSGHRAAHAACMAVGTLAHMEAGKTSDGSIQQGDKREPSPGAGEASSVQGSMQGPGQQGTCKPASADTATSTGLEEEYEIVERSIQTLREAHLRQPSLPPLSEQDLTTMMDAEGRVSLASLRERCWQSGLEHSARRLAWPLLLGLRKASHTHEQYKAVVADRRQRYGALCHQWQCRIRDHDPSKDRQWWESCSRIDKDVGRTDRAHPVFAAEGASACKALRRMLLSYITRPGARDYCQGMSDLAAPLLVVLADESEAFAAFSFLMQRMGSNFDPDQQGMHDQLQALRRLVQLVDPQLHAHFEACDCLSYFFCFRWLLIHFKREFSYEDVLRLWEGLWSAPCGPHMHLYLAAAVLVHHRKAILTQVHDFDGMLKFSINLSGGLELQPLLLLAQALATFVGSAADDAMPPAPSDSVTHSVGTSPSK